MVFPLQGHFTCKILGTLSTLEILSALSPSEGKDPGGPFTESKIIALTKSTERYTQMIHSQLIIVRLFLIVAEGAS